jgi:hypothetical protein
VKALLAIFFSVALIVSQAMASINGPLDFGPHKVTTPKCCGRCGSCNGRDCCVDKDNSGPQQPMSAIPSHTASQNDLQILVSASHLVWEQNPAESAIAPVLVLVGPSVAAPLYQRNCSYLI